MELLILIFHKTYRIYHLFDFHIQFDYFVWVHLLLQHTADYNCPMRTAKNLDHKRNQY